MGELCDGRKVRVTLQRGKTYRVEYLTSLWDKGGNFQEKVEHRVTKGCAIVYFADVRISLSKASRK